LSPLPGVNVNGQLTLGENIGDLGGLSIAYKAWKLSLAGKPSPVLDGFSGEQRFFIGWAQAWRTKAREQYLRNQVMADPHAPAEFRANAPLSNIQEFYDAFGVKPGDKLYLPPDKRVKIW
jgi:endothelin-converting enzyme